MIPPRCAPRSPNVWRPSQACPRRIRPRSSPSSHWPRPRRSKPLLLHRATGTGPWLGGDGVRDELGDGSAVLRAAVHQLDRPDAPQAAVELPFPLRVGGTLDARGGPRTLRNSLVLTAATHDDRLVADLVEEPSISNVYVGKHPTYWMDSGLPHDGYLAEFLMRCKSVIRD
ncbi:hypothetical protein ACRAWF_19755 [Streptomyces sp. L7]